VTPVWRCSFNDLQGEPEFERLKRELEEVKHSHRGLDGTYRSQVGACGHILDTSSLAYQHCSRAHLVMFQQGGKDQHCLASTSTALHCSSSTWQC
jgi:hypothetical protein